MDSSKQSKINSLVEDQETYKFLLEDLLEQNPSDTAGIAELQATIKKHEDEIAELLGSPPGGSSEASSRNTPNGVVPRSPPPAYPTTQSHSTSSPADPVSAPYHPSTAPSPFLTRPTQAVQPVRTSMPSRPNESRKRQRQDSLGSTVHPQSAKRTAVNRHKSRFEELQADMESQLKSSRELHEEAKDPQTVQTRAVVEGISTDEVLEKMEREQKEEEDAIRSEFQMEMDEEMARMVQAEEAASDSDDDRSSSPLPVMRIPDRTLPIPHIRPYGTPSLIDPQPPRQYPVPTHFDYNPAPPGSYPYRDDDLQEIPREYFNSRVFGPTGYNPFAYRPPGPSASALNSPALGPPRYTPMFGGPNPLIRGRSLPWMHDPIPAPEMAAIDLLSNNPLGLEDADDLERYEEQNFPHDIKNLITGIKDIREATKAEKDETPEGLKVTLMKHQKIGVAWMKAKEESAHKGGILADDMGLGKTVQAIALMVARPPTDPERHPSLIVAPKALMDQWKREIHRHIQPGKHQLSVFVYHGANRVDWRKLKSYDVVITTFGTLTASFKTLLKAEKLEEEGKDASIVRDTRNSATLFTPVSKWHRVIVDEAQNIKNPSAKSAKACCRLNATYRWCLTGTPMMNRLEDFQSLLSFLRIRPYNNKEKFKRDFRVVKTGFVPEPVMQQLRILVKAVCFRRTKTSKIDGQPILQLPPKVIEKVHVVFDEKEREVYDALSSRTQAQIERLLNAGILGKSYSHVLVLLLRLRQACCHPHLMQGISTKTADVDGRDMVANAKLLAPAVVDRIKNNEGGEDEGTCPICMDIVENAVIYIPCGHSVCNECFARISDPQILARDDDTGMIKCQNCRGPVDPLKITDGESFKKVYDPAAVAESSAAAEQDDDQSDGSESDDWDSGTETEGSSDRPKKKSLAELRKEGQRNKRAKRRYLRRLEKSWIPSAKITKAVEILGENEERGKGEKTIIFSQFTSLLDLLEVPINRKGWNYVRFDGSMNITERNESVARFTDDPEVKIMLVSLKAGNAGLNLIAASHVVLFDPFWNPYVEDQAIDRAHRIGQTKDVYVHRLLIENTVEDRIIHLQEQKRELISGALDEGGSMNVSRLDVRELAYLFGVRT
ncbi:uncharacterized protein N7473_001997 [Penicillium subrubescens]|uniref:Uncharacterized protein n=1 Tax=Penicillium subrubescens TaxID=1316194 RepID=A0A1Q5SQM9_9EURO|nr:uncharacterized protein N7473_001997 [Penicillium subrubescens]KAJ5905081.1 hypothetical protein N7473_001997 [Penicillium subrubescens]OKO90262.1 hypothetical protein PENSUB_13395 [Penicillium subrubescens]